MEQIVKFMEKIAKKATYGPFMYHKGLASYKNYLIAADGKQLAVYWHGGQIPSGYFKIEKDKLVKTADINSVDAPPNATQNFDIIISIAKDDEKYASYTPTIFSFKDGKDNIFVNSICKLMLNSGVAFNFELIKPLGKISDIWGVDYKGQQDNLRFSTGDFTYCLMPIKL